MSFNDKKHAAFGVKIGMDNTKIEHLLSKRSAFIFSSNKAYTTYRFGKWEMLVYYTNQKATMICLTTQKYSNGELP